MTQTQTRKETEPLDPWMSLGDAAEALGLSRQTVLTRVVAGELTAKHIAGRTVVSRDSVKKSLAKK